VKWSYYSNYVYRELNIYCFEFNDIPSNLDGYDGGGGGGNQRENSNINEIENQYEASPLIGRPDNDIHVRTIDINDYLQTFHMSIQLREGKTYEEMLELWKLHDLEIRLPQRKFIKADNELHTEVLNFYLNLHTFEQLIADIIADVNVNIEYGEEYSAK
uniref:Uncharacterized protein n=1 Tax=Glossina morsitans morsitans TaxID=37546 RepID=A0A1B0FAP7_GLOMM